MVDIAEKIPVAYATGEIPPLEGHLYSPFIHDATTGETYYSGSLPADLPLEHRVIAGAQFMNDGELATLTARVELVDPDGIVRIYGIGEKELDTGEHTGVQTGTSVKLDKGGTWEIHATLEAEGTLLDDEIWDAIQPIEYAGSIAKKTLRYDSKEAPIPVSDIPAGIYEGLVIIRGRNDTSVNQKIGVHWIVKDPDGLVVPSGEYTRWENTWTGPGLEQAFIDQFGAFALDKEGDYTLEVQLLMNPDNPTTVDSYDGVLCRVSAQEYKGAITTKLLDYDESRVAIPASDVPISSGSVLIWGRNDTSTTQQMGISWKVRDPDGAIVDSYDAWEMWPYCPPGDEHGFVGNRFDIDKEGVYTLEVDLLMNYGDPVIVDSYIGTLCSTTGAIPPEYELIYENIYPFAYIYSGEVKITTATFRTDPFTPAGWLGEIFANKLEEEARAEGRRVIEVKVYVDVTPLLWKDFRIEVSEAYTAVAIPYTVGSPGWPAIIIAALLIIGIIVAATILVKTISKAFKAYPGLEDMKPAWSKETLIMTIQDSEEYWERPPTPESTLQAMSEAELRDSLDQIAEEEVPPKKPSIWPWVAAGAVVSVAIVAVVKGAVRR